MPPPVPQGFTPITPEEFSDMAAIDPSYTPNHDPRAPAPEITPLNVTTTKTDESADGQTAVPRMMTPIEQREALAALTPERVRTYNQELVDHMNDPNATKEGVREWARSQGQDLPNLDEMWEHRGPHTRFDTSIVHNANQAETDDYHFRENAIRETMVAHGLNPDNATIANFAHGFAIRAPARIMEGLAQLGLRGAAAAGFIREVDANMASAGIANEASLQDEAVSRAPGSETGAFAGDIAATSLLPLGRVTRFGRAAEAAGVAVPRGARAANTAATLGRRVAVGAASGAMRPAATGDEQNLNVIIGGLSTPLMVPVAERVFAYAGERGTEAFMRIAGQGIGQRIRDANGQLTPYGAALRRRLVAVNPDVPEELVDHALDAIVRANPRRLPADRDVVPDALATDQNVPLTGGMRARDTSRIDDFEQARQGQFGPRTQQQAEQRSEDIDTSIIDNVRDIGDGRTSGEAAQHLGERLDETERAAAAHRDELYEGLKQSNERIVNPGILRGIIRNFNDRLAGQADADIASPIVKNLLSRIYNLSQRGEISTSREVLAPGRGVAIPGTVPPTPDLPPQAPPLRFGELWNMSREINSLARTAQGSDAHYLQELRGAMNDFLGGMSDDAFESGSNGVARNLREANSTNAQFLDRFGQRDLGTRTGRNIVDRGGQAIERIVGQMRNPNSPPNFAQIEDTIFGSGRGLNTAGARQATTNIQRIVRAGGEEVRQDVKALTVNRVISQITDGITPTALRSGKMQNVVNEIVEHNRPMLEAAGWTPADITRLRVNAYLASLKTIPPGAGNASRSARMVRAAVGTIFRNRIASALSAGGGATILGGFNPYTLAIIGGVAGGAKLSQMRLASRALSDRVGSRMAGPATDIGHRAGQTGAAALSRQFSLPGDDQGDDQ